MITKIQYYSSTYIASSIVQGIVCSSQINKKQRRLTSVCPVKAPCPIFVFFRRSFTLSVCPSVITVCSELLFPVVSIQSISMKLVLVRLQTHLIQNKKKTFYLFSTNLLHYFPVPFSKPYYSIIVIYRYYVKLFQKKNIIFLYGLYYNQKFIREKKILLKYIFYPY